jgi:hypothetical protein
LRGCPGSSRGCEGVPWDPRDPLSYQPCASAAQTVLHAILRNTRREGGGKEGAEVQRQRTAIRMAADSNKSNGRGWAAGGGEGGAHRRGLQDPEELRAREDAGGRRRARGHFLRRRRADAAGVLKPAHRLRISGATRTRCGASRWGVRVVALTDLTRPEPRVKFSRLTCTTNPALQPTHPAVDVSLPLRLVSNSFKQFQTVSHCFESQPTQRFSQPAPPTNPCVAIDWRPQWQRRSPAGRCKQFQTVSRCLTLLRARLRKRPAHRALDVALAADALGLFEVQPSRGRHCH